MCDHYVYIPQSGRGTASLNVAIATSIVLHHYSCSWLLEPLLLVVLPPATHKGRITLQLPTTGTPQLVACPFHGIQPLTCKE